jgi:hypothetical protein
MFLTRALRGGVQTVGDGVEIAIEEAGVDVERHGRAGGTEHPLDGLDVGAGGHGEASRVCWGSCGVRSPRPAGFSAGSKRRRRQLRSMITPLRGAVKTRSSGDLPTQAVARASTKERGTGTERQ